MGSECVWIGIGVPVPEKSALHENLAAMSDFLATRFGDGVGSDVFHLNLYDLAVPKENLKTIIDLLSERVGGKQRFTTKVEGVGSFPFGAIWLGLEMNPKLFDLHTLIVQNISPLRGGCIEKSYLEDNRTYTQNQKEMLARYGNPFMLGEFRPHITIGFIGKTQMIGSFVRDCGKLLTENEFLVDAINVVTNSENGKYKELKKIRLI